MLKRHRLLLRLLDELGGRVGRTDFQKLLFLYCMDEEGTRSFDFVPYSYGCFSLTCYADWRKLVRTGMLEKHDSEWRITAEGRAVSTLSAGTDTRVQEFCRRMKLRNDPLIAQTYRGYPYYAINSKIIDRLDLSAAECDRIEAHRPRPRPAGLLTIGYEGRNLEQYLNILIRASVSLLCDVRRNPISRKYGFSKSTLSNACEHVGISYVHLPALGIPSENRKGLKSREDYAALFEAYETRSLPRQHDELSRIGDWIAYGQRVALTCFEHDPGQCHRHCVANAVEGLSRREISTEHL